MLYVLQGLALQADDGVIGWLKIRMRPMGLKEHVICALLGHSKGLAT